MHRAFVVLFLLAFACARHAGAASTTNFSDQWWNPNESGWGASFLQQADVIFIDLFVFDADTKQTWFTVAARYQGTNAAGELNFGGDLYLVSGPDFGGPFNPNNVTRRKVGTLTFRATSVDTGVLIYSVDSVGVVKNISRQLWAFENLTGNYYGGLIGNFYCANPGLNGPREAIAAFNINHTPSNTVSIAMTDTTGEVCNFLGAYSQAGHMGTVQGNYNCTGGDAGSFTLFEVEKNLSGLTGRFLGQNSSISCQFDRHIGGVRR